MHVEFLLEELSAEAALRNLLPAMLPIGATFVLHSFNGKPDLLRNLEDRLRAYRRWIPADWRIVVLVDEDRQDCRQLKARLERSAVKCGFSTKTSAARNGVFQVINRIAVEELESWFFGDPEALTVVYPRISARTLGKPKYRNPDTIGGGTAEALASLLKRAGYYAGGIPKIEVADCISKAMNPVRNRSQSFQVFREGLRTLT
jgi:hypothetical protein